MRKNVISVIVPTYNRARTLRRAVDSVRSQTLPVDEIIIVDDGSTDSTDSILAELSAQDSRIRILRQQRRGAGAARNLGLRMAVGSLIAFQDSDDEWHPEFIKTLSEAHQHPSVVAFCSLRSRNLDGAESINYPSGIRDARRMLRRENCISTQTALVSASLLERHQFDESLPRLQDWDLWLSMVNEATFVHYADPLATQFLQSDSITRGGDNIYAALRTITRKHWKFLAWRPGSFVRWWLISRLRSPKESR